MNWRYLVCKDHAQLAVLQKFCVEQATFEFNDP
jgi:hypothetical protein